jgi:mutator protein MutT
MLNKLLGGIWRLAPVSLKRWTMRRTHARFLVTAGAIITDDRGQVLLLKHRFRPGAGWGIPGGYIDAGEQPDEALRRELGEEVGLQIENIKLFEIRAFAKPQQVEIIFRCRAVGNPGRLNYEIEKAEWFSLGDLPRELPEDQLDQIQRSLGDGVERQD